MNRIPEFLAAVGANPATFSFLAEIATKATVVLAMAAALALASWRGSAARRHLIWACALGVLVLMPALQVFLPAWKVRSPAVAWMAPIDVTQAVEVTTGTIGVDAGAAQPATPAIVPAAPEPGAGASIPPVEPRSHDAAERTGRAPIDWRSLAVFAWALGAVLVLAVFGAGHLVLRGLARDARLLRSGEWHDLALEAADHLGLTLPFALLQGRGVPVPVAFGLLRARVLLPPEADAWPRERRRSVLLHELAHVERHDCLTQAVAQLACALFWFHPVVWWAGARLRIERERACDDRVLASRTRATDYADHLLDVVRSLRATRIAALGAVSFARKSSLEGRLLAVLDPARDRRAVHVRTAIPAALLAALLALPLAALEPGPVEAGAAHAVKSRDGRPSDPARARPSRVERPASPAATLEAGLAWADAEAKRAGERGVWIGWRTGTSSKLEGGLLGDTEGIDLSQLTAPGIFTLDDVLAGREQGTSGNRSGAEPRPAALLIRRSGGSLTRVRNQSFDLPADFAGEPLYWLDTIPAAQTFAWLKTESGRARDVRVRARLVESAGYLDATELVLPFLNATLEGGDVSEVRGAAAMAIAWHPSPDGVRRLTEHARNDRSIEVRRASVEALGQFRTPEALKALLVLAREGDEETRRQAFDAMGQQAQAQAEKSEPRSAQKKSGSGGDGGKHVAVYAAPEARDPGPPDEPSQAMDARDLQVQRQVIESLGRYPESESLMRLKQIAETSPSADLRSAAVESIARIGTPAALDLLSKVAWTNRSMQARMTAVELLRRALPPEQALDQLEKIASAHPSPDTRRVAIESIGRFDSPRVTGFLEKTIRGPADVESQRQAVESLGRREEDGIDDRLLEIAQSHPVVDVRRQAVETIGHRGAEGTMERLVSVARGDGPEDVRRQAVETIGRLDDPRVKRILLDLAWHGTPPDVARQAVESLGRIEEDTMADLAGIARSHPSGDVRRQAVETMSRRDPERAIPILDEILGSKKKGGV